MGDTLAGLRLGIARARLGPAAAIIDPQRGVGACEENRLTRARQAPTSGPPTLATAELLAYFGRSDGEIVARGVVRDPDSDAWYPRPAIEIDAHHAHAEYAFRASTFDDALVVVCDASVAQGWSAWRYRDRGTSSAVPVVADVGHFPIARIYGELTEALGLQSARDEHVVEAMARAGEGRDSAVADAITIRDHGIEIQGTLSAILSGVAQRDDADRGHIASSAQRRLGECLVELLTRLAHATGAKNLCLSGGLFFNTQFTTASLQARAFEHSYIPPHPGRSGSAVGAALLVGDSHPAPAALGSPYLGPGYSDADVKAALENCKLAYDLQREDRVLATVVNALSRGHLVGWFHGRLEWGPRALGHRTVLADPFSAHVLDNLNGYLKKRPAYRTYGVSVPRTRLAEFFDGSHESPHMQYEYHPRDPEKFRWILPPGVKTLRVHTVDERTPRYLRLLEQWGEVSGAPVLVNTSFNGFHEPLVCSPRDAIRVFYGTGLDLLALEDFILRK